jgi:hypothetical protein
MDRVENIRKLMWEGGWVGGEFKIRAERTGKLIRESSVGKVFGLCLG